jgi:hypothetical protein
MDEADRERELIAILFSALHARDILLPAHAADGFHALLQVSLTRTTKGGKAAQGFYALLQVSWDRHDTPTGGEEARFAEGKTEEGVRGRKRCTGGKGDCEGVSGGG